MIKVSSLFIISFLLAVIFGCGKVKNSSSADGGAVVGTSEFISAIDVISSKCFSCHSSWSNYAAADYVKKGLVFKGSPANSTLYTRIRGNAAGVAGDMPPGQPNLSIGDIRTIKEWIESLQ